jgi:hypothetical protein
MVFGTEMSDKLIAEQLTAYGVFCTGFRAYRLQLLVLASSQGVSARPFGA